MITKGNPGTIFVWSFYLLWKSNKPVLKVKTIILLFLNNFIFSKFPSQESEQMLDYIFFAWIMDVLMWGTKARCLAFHSNPGKYVQPYGFKQAGRLTSWLNQNLHNPLKELLICHLDIFCVSFLCIILLPHFLLQFIFLQLE